MSFISLRAQLENWTLQSDDKCFEAIRHLSETIFETEKQIADNLSATRHALAESQVNVGCSFNHFLKLSEFKFTENKIQERLKDDGKGKSAETKAAVKSKMDGLKQALQIGLTNLQIRDEGDKDAVSVVSMSEYSFAMSQAVFKNARLPPYYGSKEFIGQPFLNLFSAQQLDALESKSMSISNLPTSPPNSADQNGKQSLKPENASLAPPPPLSQVLANQQYQSVQQNSSSFLVPTQVPLPIPPAPTFSLLPPPPLAPVYQAPLSNTNSIYEPTPEPLPSMSAATKNTPISPSSNSEQESPSPPPKQVPQEPKTLSLQDELNLRLKFGKNYKVPSPVVPQKPQPQATKPIQVIQTVEEPPKTGPVPHDFRKSLPPNITNLVNQTTNPFGSQNLLYEQQKQQQQEQESIVFKKTKKNKPVQQPQESAASKNMEDIFKKNSFVNSVLIKKQQPKKTLFEAEEQEGISFKKADKKTIEPKVEEVKEKLPQAKPAKKKNLFDEDDLESQIIIKKPKPKEVKPEPKVETKSKKINLLLMDPQQDIIPSPVNKKETKQPNKAVTVSKVPEVIVTETKPTALPLKVEQSQPSVSKTDVKNPLLTSKKPAGQLITKEDPLKTVTKSYEAPRPTEPIVKKTQNMSAISEQSSTSAVSTRKPKPKRTKQLDLFKDDEDEGSKSNISIPQQIITVKSVQNPPSVARKTVSEVRIGQSVKQKHQTQIGADKQREQQQLQINKIKEKEKKDQERRQKEEKARLIKLEEQKQKQRRKKQQEYEAKQIKEDQERRKKQQEDAERKRQQQKRQKQYEEQAQKKRQQQRRQRQHQKQQRRQEQLRREKQKEEAEAEKRKQDQLRRKKQQQQAEQKRQEQIRKQKQIEQQAEQRRIEERRRQKEQQEAEKRIQAEQQQKQRLAEQERIRVELQAQRRKQEKEKQKEKQDETKIKMPTRKLPLFNVEVNKQSKTLVKTTGQATKKANPLGLPSLSVMANQPPKKPKNTLMLEEDDKVDQLEPKPQKKVTAVAGKKKSLFDDDDDNDFAAKIKTKEKPTVSNTPAGKKKSLFNDQDDGDTGFPPPKKNAIKQPPAKVETVKPTKKKTLFDNDDEYEQNAQKTSVTVKQSKLVSNIIKKTQSDEEQIQKGPKKTTVPLPTKVEKQVILGPKAGTNPRKKNLFDDQDEQQTPTPKLKKQVEKKEVKIEPKVLPKTVVEGKNKKTLFADSQDSQDDKKF